MDNFFPSVWRRQSWLQSACVFCFSGLFDNDDLLDSLFDDESK